jgi:hypothetical protein
VTTTEPIAAYPVQGGAPEPPRRMQRWVFVTTIVWVLVLIAAFAWAVRRGEPTAREQTTIGDATPVMTQARAELARAAASDGLAVVALTGVERSECDVSVARPGVRLQAPVLAFVPPGTEEALIQRVADRLPDSYEVNVRTGSAPRLSGDAGLWVAVGGAVIAPGQVRFVADTGNCRYEGEPGPPRSGPGGNHAPAQAALDQLGLSAQSWTTYIDGCAGGSVKTVEAVAPANGPLDVALAGFAGAERVVATPELVAYRAGPTGVAARLVNGQVVVTSTSVDCTE